MTALVLTAEEVYKANIGKEGSYVRVYVAREVKAGETAVDERADAPISSPEDGYALYREEYSPRCDKIINKSDFDKTAVAAENLALPLPKKDMDEKDFAELRPIKKGETIYYDVWAKTIMGPAPYDGFRFEKGGKSILMSNHQLISQFNYAGQKNATYKELLVTLNDEAPVKGIILDKPTTILDRPGDDPAYAPIFPAGTFISRVTRDGKEHYNIESETPNTFLRVAHSDYHQIALDSQAQLKKKSQEMKTRRAAPERAPA